MQKAITTSSYVVFCNATQLWPFADHVAFSLLVIGVGCNTIEHVEQQRDVHM
jgi:hypothetical protein